MTAPLPSRVANPPIPPGEGHSVVRPLPRGEGRGEGAHARADRGFTLVELLVVTALVAALAALMASAVSAVRDNAKIANTANAIARLDQVIMNQFRRYEWRSVPTATVTAAAASLNCGTSAARAWHIRRNWISADMPDRWSDVALISDSAVAIGTTRFPLTEAQRSYKATYDFANPKPTDQYGGAECLFMIVMQGGFADCLDCNGLAQITKGDKDNDGAPEFWDDWGNPIDYILWAPGFRPTGGAGNFFGTLDAAFPPPGPVRPGLGMTPIIYSAGPDGQYGLNRNNSTLAVTAVDSGTNTPNLSAGASPTGRDCGNPNPGGTSSVMGSPVTGGDGHADNIVNVELTRGS